jgi:hypothetical protein
VGIDSRERCHDRRTLTLSVPIVVDRSSTEEIDRLHDRISECAEYHDDLVESRFDGIVDYVFEQRTSVNVEQLLGASETA